ncbi:MAG TPA: 23S rRNA (adenine(2503)-C(2))-methyltransferase RlmN, partial [Bacteroidales bacterium]|nr:23S rRNA (adenine(2503)-C(2))-methyltransferase RlmN [Bacteroidales bacterium]HPS73718.1 23S rRNA (adenine(2503)-C(2))-methyltransferase RlmN [Bacteroidales bacterium]
EYVMLGNVNDSEKDARDLALFCKNFPVKINLIEYNAVEGSGYAPATEARIQAFVSTLERKNLVVNVRKSRGKDIDAACGQLVGRS